MACLAGRPRSSDTFHPVLGGRGWAEQRAVGVGAASVGRRSVSAPLGTQPGFGDSQDPRHLDPSRAASSFSLFFVTVFLKKGTLVPTPATFHASCGVSRWNGWLF